MGKQEIDIPEGSFFTFGQLTHENNEIQGTSMKCNENHVKSNEINQRQSNPMKFNESQMKSNGIQCKSNGLGCWADRQQFSNVTCWADPHQSPTVSPLNSSGKSDFRNQQGNLGNVD